MKNNQNNILSNIKYMAIGLLLAFIISIIGLVLFDILTFKSYKIYDRKSNMFLEETIKLKYRKCIVINDKVCIPEYDLDILKIRK